MVGAGVLSLPYAMSQLGWSVRRPTRALLITPSIDRSISHHPSVDPVLNLDGSPCREVGVTVLVLSWAITLYTLWQMVEMHECVPGKRFDRYHELGQHAFGERLGLWIVVPQQLVVEVGLNIVYMVAGGTSLKKFHDTICGDHNNNRCSRDIKLTYFIMILASCHFVLYSQQLPNLHSPLRKPTSSVRVLLLPCLARRLSGLRQRRRREHPRHPQETQVASSSPSPT
jgi:hypothetical protein